MIHNVSYPNKKRTKEIDAYVGKPYNFINRLKLKGIGSPRLALVSASENINSIYRVGNATKYCNIELRPNGIIIWLRNAQETFIWVAANHHLSILRSSTIYSIHSQGEYIKVEKAYNFQNIDAFFGRLLDNKIPRSS